MYRVVAILFVSALLLCAAGSAAAQGVTPIAECLTLSDATMSVRLGYQSIYLTTVQIPITPENNIFIGGITNPYLGQPVEFAPGRAHDVFRADFDLNESPSYAWVLDGHILSINASVPACRDRDQRQIIGLLECVQPPASGSTVAQARFAYVNLGGALALPQRSSRNYFASPNGAFGPSRGQVTTFQPGLNRNAFTVSFDTSTEPLITWEIDGESVPAAVGMPNVPACTPVASDTVFRNGFEFAV